MMFHVKTKLLLVPNALVAVNVVVTGPLVVGVPEMAPVLVFRLNPAGSVLAPASAYERMGGLLALIW